MGQGVPVGKTPPRMSNIIRAYFMYRVNECNAAT